MDATRRSQLLEQYAAGYDEVIAALDDVGDRLDATPSDGGWTPRQIAHHLGDSEITSAIRLRRLLAEDDPVIPAYDEEAFARRLHYERPIEPSLQAFQAARATNLALLAALDEDEWRRTGRHSDSGAYSVETWLEIYAAHGHEHAEQMRAAVRG